jgi:hypothetical protein
MGLTTAGLTALMDNGTAATVYAAVGDGPTSTDQVSNERILITWGTVGSQGVSASNAPISFTGPSNADATYALLFSAASAGTFYGYAELGGEVLFNADGDFQIGDISLDLSDPDDAPAVPAGPFTLGVEVGVPTGTTLTASSGLGVNDGTEEITLTDPLTGEESTFEVTVYRRRRWTSTINPAPGAGVAFLFDECEFDVASDNFCVDGEGADPNAQDDRMLPSLIFRRCSFDGNNTTGKCLVSGYAWLEECDLRNTEDAWSGLYWSTAIRSNFICTTDGGPDPHSDGLQSAGIGEFLVWNCWADSGDDSASSNAPVRVGTEFSAVNNVGVYYTGLAGTQHGLQFRGDAGAGDIAGVQIIGNRWVDEQIYGPVDFEDVTDLTWENNAFFGGEVIPSP